MKNYYAVKLVLKDGEYFVESHSPSILNIIQQRVLGQVEMSNFSTTDEETVPFPPASPCNASGHEGLIACALGTYDRALKYWSTRCQSRPYRK